MNNLFLIAFQESCANFLISTRGLEASYKHCKKIRIKTDYLFEENEAYDALIIKLTRNSDIFFQQIIKGYFKLKGEDRLLFIDRLNMLEKMEVITNADGFLNLKSFRNQAVHEYSHINFQLLYEEYFTLVPILKNSINEFWEYLRKEKIVYSL